MKENIKKLTDVFIKYMNTTMEARALQLNLPANPPANALANPPANSEITNLEARMDARMARIEALLTAVRNTSGMSLMKGG